MEPLSHDGKEKFICPSCLWIVKNPVEWMEWETPFCKEWFDSWFSNKKECMQCRSPDGSK